MEVEYIGHMGSDLTVVNAARVSFHKRHEVLEKNDAGLINYLAAHGHFTPFTHPQITMRLKAPIITARQAFKSQVGFSPPNEVSRRYVTEAPEFYDPGNWRLKPDGSIKQGSGKGISASPAIPLAYETALTTCLAAYNLMLEHNIAPELARMVLPQSLMTEWYWTGSLAAWARFYNLRSGEDAQYEIQLLADHVAAVLRPLFPLSWEALRE